MNLDSTTPEPFERERFDRLVEKLQSNEQAVDKGECRCDWLIALCEVALQRLEEYTEEG